MSVFGQEQNVLFFLALVVCVCAMKPQNEKGIGLAFSAAFLAVRDASR